MSDDASNLQQREERWPGGDLKARWTVILGEGCGEERHGEYLSFHENGMQHERGQYAYGEPVGEWSRWDATGAEIESGVPEGDTESEPDPDAGKPWGVWSIELAVVMALAWLPHMALGAVSLWNSWRMQRDYSEEQLEGVYSYPAGADEFLMSELPTLAMHLQVLIPLLYICWRSDLSWKQLGVVKPKWWGLLLLGPLLAGLTLGADVVLDRLFQPGDAWWWMGTPTTTITWVVLIISLVANSLAEEFVWRGFVLQRLKQMGGSVVFALFVSSFLFATYHLYQGFGNAGLVFVSGLIWGVAVLVTKRIWPAVVGHTLHNIVLYTPLADRLFP